MVELQEPNLQKKKQKAYTFVSFLPPRVMKLIFSFLAFLKRFMAHTPRNTISHKGHFERRTGRRARSRAG
jgi:hypothetical protein